MADNEQKLIVFCFDRDLTVDTSMGGPVPLEWVRKLAHETRHPVYATGNQKLKREADIPGVEEMKRKLGIQKDIGGDRRHVFLPARRERVRMAEKIHEDANQYIVVDDVDLSDMDGWRHYFPETFVTEFQDREIDGIVLE